MAAKSLELLSSINDRFSASEAAKQKQIIDATLAVVEQVVEIMLEREAKDALDAARKPGQFLKWMDGFYADHTGRMEKALTKPIRACALALGRFEPADEIIRQAVSQHVAAGRESLLLAASVPVDQFPKSVETCVAGWKRRHIIDFLGASNGSHN
jgi:hypothetical protein